MSQTRRAIFIRDLVWKSGREGGVVDRAEDTPCPSLLRVAAQPGVKGAAGGGHCSAGTPGNSIYPGFSYRRGRLLGNQEDTGQSLRGNSQ